MIENALLNRKRKMLFGGAVSVFSVTGESTGKIAVPKQTTINFC